MTPRRVALFLLLVGLVLSGCEPAPGPPPAASSGSASPPVLPAPLTPATRERMEKLYGEWLVTTPETLATAKYFEPQIAAAESPEARAALEQVRDLNVRRLAPIVRWTPSYFAFHTVLKPNLSRQEVVKSRRYDLLRAHGDEVEIQVDGEGGGRVVLIVSGRDEIRATELAHFVGGTIWRRAGTPGAGLP